MTNADMVRDWRLRQVAAGMCSRCSREPAAKGYKTCSSCLERDRQRRERLKPKRVHESPRWRELEASTARCKCGLLAPCFSCGPSIYELASGRQGPGRTP